MPSSQLLELGAACAERLVAREQTVSVAESSAGGLISAALLAVPGASRYYVGGAVFYTREGLTRQLGGNVVLERGVKSASEPFSGRLAAGVRAQIGTDWGVGETGAAGPSGNPYGDPAGHSWVAVAGPADAARAERVLTGSEDRVANMEAFAAAALRLLRDALA